MLVLAMSRFLFEIPHRIHVAIMQRFTIFVFVSEIKSTMLSESRFGGFTFLAVIDTTVGAVEFGLATMGKS